jgi:hypothetical protein
MVEVVQSSRLFLTMKTRIALDTDAKSIRVTNDRFVEFTRAVQEQHNHGRLRGKPASDLLIYVGRL